MPDELVVWDVARDSHCRWVVAWADKAEKHWVYPIVPYSQAGALGMKERIQDSGKPPTFRNYYQGWNTWQSLSLSKTGQSAPVRLPVSGEQPHTMDKKGQGPYPKLTDIHP